MFYLKSLRTWFPFLSLDFLSKVFAKLLKKLPFYYNAIFNLKRTKQTILLNYIKKKLKRSYKHKNIDDNFTYRQFFIKIFNF